MSILRATRGIRIRETVIQRHLVREHPIREALKTLTMVFIFGSPFFLLVHVTDLDLSRSNNQVLAFVLTPITAFFCLFVIYRLLTENRFQRTPSSLGAVMNKQVIIHLLQRQGIHPRQTGREYVITASEGSYPGAQPCTMMFLIEDNQILSNVLTLDRFRGRIPTLIGHWLLQRDIGRAVRSYHPSNA